VIRRGEVRAAGTSAVGLRTMLVLSDDQYNTAPYGVVVAVRVSTSEPPGLAPAVRITDGEGVVGWVLPDTLMQVPKKWFKDPLGTVGPETMANIVRTLRIVLDIT